MTINWPPGRRGEEGQIFPILLVAFVATMALGVVLFQVGSATDIRAQAQTAADAAGLEGATTIGNALETASLTGPLGGTGG